MKIFARLLVIMIGYCSMSYAMQYEHCWTQKLPVKVEDGVNILMEKRFVWALAAVNGNNLEIVHYLIDNHIVAVDQLFGSFTLLQVAVMKNFKDIVSYLVQQGASLYTKNRHGSDALMLAYDHGASLDIKLLLTNALVADLTMDTPYDA